MYKHFSCIYLDVMGFFGVVIMSIGFLGIIFPAVLMNVPACNTHAMYTGL